MCVTWTGKWQVAKRTITAYKLCRIGADGIAKSFWPPERRSHQSDDGGAGRIRRYPIGKTIVDRSASGFYLYREPPRTHTDAVLLVKIKKGAEYRMGRDMCLVKTINAREIEIVKRVR